MVIPTLRFNDTLYPYNAERVVLTDMSLVVVCVGYAVE